MPRVITAILLLLIFALPVGATEELAKKIEATWKLKAAEWKTAAQAAVTPEQREALLKTRPKPAACPARRSYWRRSRRQLGQAPS